MAVTRWLARATTLLLTVALTTTFPLVAFGQTGTSFELTPGVVVDPQIGFVFVMNPAGGTDALDIGTGDLAWHHDEAAKPLAVDNDHLLAQVDSDQPGRLEILVLETGSGRLVQTASADLPPGLRPTVDNGLGSSFNCWASHEGGELLIGWESSRREIRGTGAGPVEATSQALRFDSSTGQLDPVASTAEKPVKLPELQGADRLSDADERQFLSADGRHFLVSEPFQDRWEYRWTLYTIDGDKAGEVSSASSYTPFFVSGTRLVYLVRPSSYLQGEQLVQNPLSIRAVGLNSGAEAWTHEVRDISYRGPYPQ